MGIREMNKYSESDASKEGQQSHLDAQMQAHMRLFRAQRNFYISGFALFLTPVIKMLVNLISQNATIQAEKEAAIKQAEGASKAAEALMAGADGETKETKEMKEKVKELEKELTSANASVESMKKQSENLTQEYDRLMEEKDRLQRKVNIMGDGEGDKKDD